MRILSFISVALLGMVFMVSANQVQARESGDFYTSFSVGIVIPQDTETEVAGTDASGNPATFTFDTEYDVGYDISGAFGLYLGSNFRAEFTVGWREYDVTDTAFSTNAVSYLVNGYWDILGVTNPFEPYIGFGIGGASWGSSGGGGDSDRVDAFMLNTMVGANYHFTDNLAIGASYRFAYSNPEDDGASDETEVFNHSILTTVTLVF